MDFGDVEHGFAMNGYGDFLNVGNLPCTFPKGRDSAAFDLSLWVNWTSQAIAGVRALSAETAEATPRAEALRRAVHFVARPFYQPTRYDTREARRKSDAEWKSWRQKVPAWIEAVDRMQDVEVALEVGLGALSPHYPWHVAVQYYDVRAPGEARSTTACFRTDPVAHIVPQFFACMQVLARQSLKQAVELPDSPERERAENQLRALLLA